MTEENLEDNLSSARDLRKPDFHTNSVVRLYCIPGSKVKTYNAFMDVVLINVKERRDTI